MVSRSVIPQYAYAFDHIENRATEPVAEKENADEPNSLNLFYAFDGNKNVSDVFYQMNSNGIGAHYDYAPFGATTRTHRDSSASFDIVALNPFRFSSEYYDSELDLVYYNYRHYSPSLGRFLSRDPIEEQGGWNLYGFVANSTIYAFERMGLRLLPIESSADKVPVIGTTGISTVADFYFENVKFKPDIAMFAGFYLKISISGSVPKFTIRYNKNYFSSESEFRRSSVYIHEKQHFEISKQHYNSLVMELNAYEDWWILKCCDKEFTSFFYARIKLYKKRKELQNLKLEIRDYDGEALRQEYMKRVGSFLPNQGNNETADEFKKRIVDDFNKDYVNGLNVALNQLELNVRKAKEELDQCLK